MTQKLNLTDIGLSERFKQEASMYGSGFQLARVSSQYKGMYRVMTANGEFPATVSGKLGYLASAAADYPVVGDWVLVGETDERCTSAVIYHMLPRKSCVERRAAGVGSRRQVIAANIDTLFICMSLNNDYNLRRIERYLSIAWESMATPVIVLTKADLCGNAGEKIAEVRTVAPGVDVVVTSVLGVDGIEGIRGYLRKGRTVAFIGSSGVGKSTLINRLLGEEVLKTKDIREDDGKGRHTTTHRQLLVLPGYGVVIDTPGMREIKIASADMSKAFSDIEELAETCRFRDCRHEAEPDCAVKQAVLDGKLSAKRFENYKKLQREIAFDERKETMTTAQAEKQKTVDMMGSLNARKMLKRNNRMKD
ncbi:MAG: ribosome small subunit-dependent GTPase A [Bacillota bacterium]